MGFSVNLLIYYMILGDVMSQSGKESTFQEKKQKQKQKQEKKQKQKQNRIIQAWLNEIIMPDTSDTEKSNSSNDPPSQRRP